MVWCWIFRDDGNGLNVDIIDRERVSRGKEVWCFEHQYSHQDVFQASSVRTMRFGGYSGDGLGSAALSSLVKMQARKHSHLLPPITHRVSELRFAYVMAKYIH
jgi:hypothetical protein